MLSVTDSPQWRTVVGGSRAYVERARQGPRPGAVPTPVERVEPAPDGVDRERRAARHDRRRDRGTHPDQALALLADPSEDERRVLGAFDVLAATRRCCTPTRSLLPPARRARASWNYLLDTCSTSQPNVQVSYWMNRLQALTSRSTTA